jgi:chorismate mutase/prephenate dehydrogenase
MMKRFATVFLDLLAVVEGQNKALFIDKFAQVSDWFGEYADNFLQESKGMLLKANELKKT